MKIASYFLTLVRNCEKFLQHCENCRKLWLSCLFLSICFVLCLVLPAEANNLAISNISVTDQDTGNDTFDIEFDIAWDNSWFITGAPSLTANWDAAWIFAKFSTWDGSAWSDWAHCTLLNTGSSAPSGSQFAFADNEGGGVYYGAFMYRSSAGTGSVDWDDAQIRWDYGADGVADDTPAKVKVFGIEMVYIPQGNFYLGDTDCDNDGNIMYNSGCSGSGVLISTTITAALCTENNATDVSIECAGSTGTFCIDGDDGFDLDCDGIENADFPTGYEAFYMMKYELTQEQYVDFLNTLTRTQQNSRTDTQIADRYVMSNSTKVYYHSGIRAPSSIPSDEITSGNDLDGIATTGASSGDGTFGESDDGQNIAANYVNWIDGAAFSDWAALRPFTELEFEKAARGGQAVVDDEYVCGGSSGPTGAYTISNLGTASSSISANYETDPSCNQVDSTSDGSNNGPLRVGIFADSDSTRAEAGASYYGVLDLAGNLWERSVTIGNSTGRSFAGTHGDGVLSSNGNATNSDWPGFDGDHVTGSTGVNLRGGSWFTGASDGRTSDRRNGSSTNTDRYYHVGYRAARTAP